MVILEGLPYEEPESNPETDELYAEDASCIPPGLHALGAGGPVPDNVRDIWLRSLRRRFGNGEPSQTVTEL